MDTYTRKKLRAYAKFLVREENRNPYISERLLTSKQYINGKKSIRKNYLQIMKKQEKCQNLIHFLRLIG